MSVPIEECESNNARKSLDLNLNLEPSKLYGRSYLEFLLNKPMKLVITDGRTLIGQFLCTDRDQNIILGSCLEYIGSPDDTSEEEPRLLGLAMIPGRHVVSMAIDMDKQLEEHIKILKEIKDSNEEQFACRTLPREQVKMNEQLNHQNEQMIEQRNVETREQTNEQTDMSKASKSTNQYDKDLTDESNELPC